MESSALLSKPSESELRWLEVMRQSNSLIQTPPPPCSESERPAGEEHVSFLNSYTASSMPFLQQPSHSSNALSRFVSPYKANCLAAPAAASASADAH